MADRGLDEPCPDRLDPDHPLRAVILDRHSEAMRRGEPGYLDPQTGLFVFTAAYHRERGACCSTGCRHCPFD